MYFQTDNVMRAYPHPTVVCLSSKYNTHTTHNTLMAEVCGRIGHRGLSLRRAARSYYYVSNRRASNNIQHNLWIDIRRPIGFLCL